VELPLELFLEALAPVDLSMRAMAADVVAPGALVEAGAYEIDDVFFSTLGRVHWVIFRS
jgi:hypothetical protein